MTSEAPNPLSRPSTPDAIQNARVGFVGLGNMGFLMARNLATRGFNDEYSSLPLLVWNRSEDKAIAVRKAAGEDKIRIAQSPEEVALESDIILLNLANDTVVAAIYHRILNALEKSPPTKPKIFVETSTILPSLSVQLHGLVTKVPNAHFVSCPVLGAPPAADKAILILLMSGERRFKKVIAPILVPAMGRKVIDIGESIDKASTFKLIANSLILGNIELMAEAFTFAEKAGIEQDNVHTLIKEFFPAPPILGYADKLANSKFDGSQGFNIDGGIKDASHIRSLTSTFNAPMPMIDIAHQHLLTARAIHEQRAAKGEAEFSNLDWSALIEGARASAGLQAFDRIKAKDKESKGN